jgi:hypothetical protein
MWIEVVSPYVEITEQQFVSPMVGTGMSTSVLYLESNCGTQSYRNAFDEGETLFPAQVSAIIQNAYSAGFPLQTSSDITGMIPTPSLSNLWFRLVDANFKPIKLLSPLYLTLSVNPTEVSQEDIKDFIGKLPKDKPTPEQAQQMAQQQAEEQAKQAKEQQAQDVMNRALQSIIAQQERIDQMQQAQQAQQAQPAPDVSQVQGMTGEAEQGTQDPNQGQAPQEGVGTGQDPNQQAPQMTDDQLLEQQQEQTFGLLDDPIS